MIIGCFVLSTGAFTRPSCTYQFSKTSAVCQPAFVSWCLQPHSSQSLIGHVPIVRSHPGNQGQWTQTFAANTITNNFELLWRWNAQKLICASLILTAVSGLEDVEMLTPSEVDLDAMVEALVFLQQRVRDFRYLGLTVCTSQLKLQAHQSCCIPLKAWERLEPVGSMEPDQHLVQLLYYTQSCANFVVSRT